MFVLVGSGRHHPGSEKIEDFLDYIATSLKKGLELYPSTNIVFFGDCHVTNPETMDELIRSRISEKNIEFTDFKLDCFKLEESQQSTEDGFHLYFVLRNCFYQGNS